MYAVASLSTPWGKVRAPGAVFAALVLALLLAATAQAVAPPSLEDEANAAIEQVAVPFDRSLTVTPASPVSWSGTVASAQNVNFDPGEPDACGKTVDTYCDVTLVDVVPGDRYEQVPGGVAFTTGGAKPGTDLDLYVYASDAAGNATALVGASAGPTDQEGVAVQSATGHFLVVVVYFNVDQSGYTGGARFFGRSQFPPDVDRPAGLQDQLVSDPSKGLPVTLGAAPLAGSDEPERPRRRVEVLQPRPGFAGRVRVQDRDLRLLRPRSELG